MCGIAGYFSLNNIKNPNFSNLAYEFQNSLSKRGPDSCGKFENRSVLLTHTRLSIIDINERSNQPLHSFDNNYVIVLNGEIFNYKNLKNSLISKGYSYNTESDTEVVLNLFIEHGPQMFSMLDGFFSIAIYNKQKNELIVARDRYGIKPLIVHQTDDYIFFASEMKAIMHTADKFELDYESIFQYFSLTYIPPPYSIFKNVYKLEPGSYLTITTNSISKNFYVENYQNEFKIDYNLKFESATQKVRELIISSVNDRLVSDTAIGSFLSGGIDSSIVTAIAAQATPNLKTFSVGFKENSYYDETRYAEIIAKKYKTDHTAFILSNEDLLENLFDTLNYIDEPFADSSAMPLGILSKLTSKHVKVVLSGDGADEIFGGYRKHKAYNKLVKSNIVNRNLFQLLRVFKYLPQSRSNYLTDLFRKLNRFGVASNLNNKDLYLFLSTFNEERSLNKILSFQKDKEHLNIRWENYCKHISNENNLLQNALINDQAMVLQGDMLMKVDLMSMAYSLEVRPPFINQKVIDFANCLPDNFKINSQFGKFILRKAFENELGPQIINRHKRGFEVPMDKWFKNELKSLISDNLFERNFIMSQSLYNFVEIFKLKEEIFNTKYSNNQALIWSLIVFQYWWKKYESKIKK